MKKITALILAIILCFTLAIPALGSEMSVNGQAYSINGIDVYKYPLKASQYFSVETIIYFVSDAAFAQVPVNDDVGVYLVTTMEEVTALASANPYAAIVIDANAEGLFDEELLVDLARTQHIILIRGYSRSERAVRRASAARSPAFSPADKPVLCCRPAAWSWLRHSFCCRISARS